MCACAGEGLWKHEEARGNRGRVGVLMEGGGGEIWFVAEVKCVGTKVVEMKYWN